MRGRGEASSILLLVYWVFCFRMLWGLVACFIFLSSRELRLIAMIPPFCSVPGFRDTLRLCEWTCWPSSLVSFQSFSVWFSTLLLKGVTQCPCWVLLRCTWTCVVCCKAKRAMRSMLDRLWLCCGRTCLSSCRESACAKALVTERNRRFIKAQRESVSVENH
jgi:hypothetical protein